MELVEEKEDTVFDLLKSRTLRWHCPANFLVLVGLALPCWGFDVLGSVRLDLDRHPVAGATVRFTEHASGDLFETQTAASGSYVISLPDVATSISSFPSRSPSHAETQLGAAFPNPFNPLAIIPFHLSRSAQARLQVYDLLGRRVRRLVDQDLAAGTYRIVWDGTDDRRQAVAAGVYFYRLEAGEFAASRKLTMLDGSKSRHSPGNWSPKALAQARFDLEVSGIGIETLRMENVQPFAREFDAQLTVSLARRNEPLPSGASALLLGIPGGSFTMGSKEYQDESPPHQVLLDGFFLQQLEVTQAQYRLCIEAGACLEPASGEACNWGRDDRDDHPANCISWFDASRYCSWAGMRLPTEAEWEKGARGTFGWSYPWGNTPPGGAGDCDRAIMMRAGLGLGCGHDGTGPVGGRPLGASPYGLLDMAGNVWEWVMDDYDRSYYAEAPPKNPVHLGDGSRKVLRGNGWFYVDPDPDMRAANRYRMPPLRWYPYVGVRCATSGPTLAPIRAPDPGIESAALRRSDWRQRNRFVQRQEGDDPAAGPEFPVDLEEMVLVPAGRFRMGTEDGAGDERPERTVFVSAFHIDRHEVTVAEYEACVRDRSCTEPYSGPDAYRLQFEGDFTNWGKPERALHPVNAVTWFQANTYCGWANKRLPTEAEWEKAARGTEGQRYPWGDEDPDCDWIVMDDGGDGCGRESTWPVGSKPRGASPYGALDMSGNVWEWVADWWSRDYYVGGPTRDPLNTEAGEAELKVLRGGSLADQNPHIHLAANRLGYGPKSRFDYTIGFRCARALE